MKILMSFLYSNHDQIPFLWLWGKVTKRNRKGEKEGNKKIKAYKGILRESYLSRNTKLNLKLPKELEFYFPLALRPHSPGLVQNYTED